jgi:DNA-binding transcriptional regulator YhcF (GntR family)
VVDGIISEIIDGRLTPGSKLPTEMELCQQFGAGRNSVREAVKKLQAYGILYIKRADGTFVSENYNQKMLDPMLFSIILQKNSWRDFVELREMITRREELMCVQSIFMGKIPIIGEGLNEVIDFKFTNREEITTAAKKWTGKDSDPIADLKRWHKKVQQTGFTNCDMCIMSDDVATVFVNHEKVKSLLDVKNYNLAVIQPRQLPNGVTYIGTIHELGLDIYTYNEWYLDDWTDQDPKKATEKPLVPEGELVLISSNANYSMYYGAITLIDENTKEFRTVEGKYVPDTWVKRKPARRFLQLSSAPLSVPHDVDSWFVAKVI